MKRRRHIVAAGLAALLLLFSVGLPVVVASCPMMAAAAAKAPCCPQKDEGAALHAPARFDCCRTVIAAERNVNAFIVCAYFSPAPVSFVIPVPAATVSLDFPAAAVAAVPAPDIPILCSSLLI